MARNILIIQGHPDSQENHFGHALAAAYRRGAVEAGHEIEILEIAKLDFPLLSSKSDWDRGSVPENIQVARNSVAQADHLVIFYPLWLGTMPAKLKGFLEQLFRPGFAIEKSGDGKSWKKLLVGKSARIVVTMGMPALIYRWYYLAHGLKALERNILGFCGIGPIKENLIGGVEEASPAQYEKWLEKMRALGRAGM